MPSMVAAPMRLAKFLAARRGGLPPLAAEEIVRRSGRVTVAGVTVTRPGARRRRRGSASRVDGRPRSPARRPSGNVVVYAVNKPAGVVSTARDPQRRPTVVSLGAGPAAPPVPGRVGSTPTRTRPDPAHQRRRPGPPAHPPELRGRQAPTGVARHARAPRTPGGAGSAAQRGSSWRTTRNRPGARATAGPGPRRPRAHHPRGPEPPGQADVRARRTSGAIGSERAWRFGPLATRRRCRRAATGA